MMLFRISESIDMKLLALVNVSLQMIKLIEFTFLVSCVTALFNLDMRQIFRTYFHIL